MELSIGGLKGRGFTLIELLVVVAVIAILAGITLGAMGGVQQKAARERTKAEIAAIADALESYRSQRGDYPRLSPGQPVPYDAVGGYLANEKIPVRGNALLDPFGGEYLYAFPGRNNRVGFDLWSTAGAPTNEVHKHIGNW